MTGRTVLQADEYTSGRLDWTDFQAVFGDLGETPAGRGGDPERRPQRRLPTVASFPGMPADRLWAFEDARVYLGGIEAGPTDLTRMALVEFSLAYGVDWFVVPDRRPRRRGDAGQLARPSSTRSASRSASGRHGSRAGGACSG